MGDWTFNLLKLGDGPDDPGAETPVVVGPYSKCYLTCGRWATPPCLPLSLSLSLYIYI